MLKVVFMTFLMIVAAIIVEMPAFAEESQEQYLVVVDDVLDISVRGHDDLKTSASVASDGSISFPYIGRVIVKGMSLPQIEKEISQKLADGYIKYPAVSVTLSTTKSLRFFVYGEVKWPGRYILEDNMTVLKALSLAGGITTDGLYGNIKLRRKQKDKPEYKEIPIIINAGTNDEYAGGDIPIQVEDVLIVDHNKSFFVCGEVLTPGKYTLEDDMTVVKAISLAGGIAPSGVGGNIKLIHKREDDQKRVEITINLRSTATDGHSDGDMFVKPDDKIVVERSNVFFVYGAVTKPGKFILEDNMTINPFKKIRYVWNISQFKKIGKASSFERFIDCKHTKNIFAGDNCKFGKNVCLETNGKGKIIIGNNVELARHVLLSSDILIEIGDDTLVGEYTRIRDSNHGMKPDMPIRLQHHISKPVKIGRDVWIGGGCAILKGVSIGNGAVIGANSVVTKNVESYTVVAGCPARVIKRRQ